MIHAYGTPDPAVARLLAALGARGHTVAKAGPQSERRDSTLVLSAGAGLDAMALGVLLGAWRSTPGARILVVSRLGAHPDARAKTLAELWSLEEHARASGLPVLTLRLAPMLGPDAPLWNQLRRAPRLPKGGRTLINPVAETDVIETLDRALAGRAAWDGWYELAGIESLTLAELVALAREAGPPPRDSNAVWEPALEELLEHRLADPRPWLTHFALSVDPIRTLIATWVKGLPQTRGSGS
jgi:uncharacterized protein YbjT (DUF2867 family)